MDSISTEFIRFFPLLVTLALVILILGLCHYFLIKKHESLGNEHLFSRQIIMLILTLAGLLAVVLALPVSDSSRNQIIGLVGLLISGIFAFSSSTIFANLLAGIMLRITKPFRTGDFVRIGDFFGRVVERGLLDTEIQTEVRDLVSLPNTYMIAHPVTVTRTSGTIISTSLSLGYDVDHDTIETLLAQAAQEAGLTEPFVHITELGDFSITYKVSGMLEEVKSLISSRSKLNRKVLDVLHGQEIEIMSPSFMNQRKLPDDLKIIPARKRQSAPSPEDDTQAEEIMFDKAEQAEVKEQQIESVKDQMIIIQQQISEAEGDAKKRLQARLEKLQEKVKAIQEMGEVKK